jgi:hypothetical protein
MWRPDASVASGSTHLTDKGAPRTPHVVYAQTSHGALERTHSARTESALAGRTRGRSADGRGNALLARGGGHTHALDRKDGVAHGQDYHFVDDDSADVDHLLNFADTLDPDLLDDAI